MKSLATSLLVLFSAFSWAQSPTADQIPAIDSQKQFDFFYKQGRAENFKGRAQGLLLFNLDLEMIIHYKNSLSNVGGINFSLASNGNAHIHGVPVYPITGKLVYDLLDSNGQRIIYTLDGEEVTLAKKPFTVYLVESENSYKNRLSRIQTLSTQINDKRFEEAQGQMVAVVNFDIQKQGIQFYQVSQSKELIPSGVFSGSIYFPR